MSKSSTFIRLVSLFSAALLSAVFITACKPGSDTSNEKKNESKKLFEEPVTFTIMTFEHPSQKVNPDGIKYEAMKEATNVTLRFDITPQSSYGTKKAAALASGILSDITAVTNADIAKYAGNGIFMDLTDKLENELSNFYKWVKDDINWKKTKIDGKVFGMATLNADEYPTIEWKPGAGIVPVIRYDILEKNNISIPTTFEEWFDVMKQLKTIYPDSTPFSGRFKGPNLLINMEYAMGCRRDLYYDFDKEMYVYGVLQPEYRKILEFWRSCWEEGIIDHNWMSLNANTWSEGVANGKIFFWYDNGGFASIQTNTLRQNDPNALMQVMPLMANSEEKKQGLGFNRHWYDQLYALNAKTANPDKLVKFMNWCYSDEGMYINSYGKEGVNFIKKEDGSVELPDELVKKYKDKPAPDYAWQSDLGIGMLSFTPLVRTPNVLQKAMGTYDDSFQQITKVDVEAGYYKEQFVDVSLPASINTEIKIKIDEINAILYAQIREFVEGTKPMSEYDQFVADVKKAGAEDVLKAYNDALAKLK